MLRCSRFVVFVAGAIFAMALAAPRSSRAGKLVSPREFLGRRPGEDRFLAPYPRVLAYLRQLASASPRISMELAGRSTGGNEMPVVILTSEKNQSQLERYREIARQLANPDGVSPKHAEKLVEQGKVIALVTCTIHSTEVGCTQMAMTFAHQFATTASAWARKWMDDVVLLLMPSVNPDGQLLVVDWYQKYLGTPYEGGRMPWLYHQYVGHDNNRDYYMLTQKETRVVNDLLYHRWFPQVFLDEHQMRSTGPRMFVPPQTDPLAAEIHPLVFRQADLLGTQMSLRLEEAGKRGVGHNMIYDSYWPGGTRNTAWWKNVTGLLTEVASARIASPIYIEPGELKGGKKGLPEYKRRANFPSPWEGGWWRLGDIIEYELIATWSLLESCSRYRTDLLRNVYHMGREAIRAGQNEPPYAWVIPPTQHDPVAAGELVELLLRHGVRVFAATHAIRSGLQTLPPGTVVIPAAQPYRPFLLTMLRPQRYPEVTAYSGGPVLPPYDVTAWSLPILMGVEVLELDEPLRAKLERLQAPKWRKADVTASRGGHLIPHRVGSAFAALNGLLKSGKEVYWLGAPPSGAEVGDLYLPPGQLELAELRALAERLHLPVYALKDKPRGPALLVRPVRIGLYKPWVANMDEGWTRWLLEQHGFSYASIENRDLQKGSFSGRVDVLVFPDVEKAIIASGEPEALEKRRRWAPLPPPYAGGIDRKKEGRTAKVGGKEIKEWVEDGGTVVALDSSTEYFIDLFKLPVVNVLKDLPRDAFHAPGSMLRLRIDNRHPLGYGLRRRELGYFAGSPAFETFVPDARFRRRVVAWYPDHEDDILASGYLKGGKLLERRAAVVELKVKKGSVILIGFRAQHRAQPHRTFKLFFNSLYLARTRPVTL